MKRVGFIACFISVIFMMTSVVAFADSNFELESSYPKDGQQNTTIENMSVKLNFNQELGDPKYLKQNEKSFKITSEDGEEFPIRVFINPDDKKKVLVVVDVRNLDKTKGKDGKPLVIKDNTLYKLSIDKALTDNKGEQLKDNYNIVFRTINQKRNTYIYMIIMAVMMFGMVFFTSRSHKKHMEQEEDSNDTFNPYKEAKKTGKPLAQIIAEHEKEVVKREAKAAKKRARDKMLEIEMENERDINHYKVKNRKPIAEFGGKAVSPYKAIIAAKKAEKLARKKVRTKSKKKK